MHNEGIMESSIVGKVIVKAKVENLDDAFSAELGRIKAEDVRSLEVEDALIDTAATTLSLPRRFVAQLGLQPFRVRQARTSAGVITLRMFRAVRLTIQGRDCICDVIEIPDDCPVLIGQIPLEALDFVVDVVNQKLIGNPDHHGEHMVDLFGEL
jgi:predicted aspartyl protease